MSDIKFIDGLFVKPPHDKAPDFVKCAISIKREELVGWLQKQEGEWVNLDVKEAKTGKWYAAINDWKPKSEQEGARKPPVQAPDEPFYDDDLGF